jgi:hypothetical protein
MQCRVEPCSSAWLQNLQLEGFAVLMGSMGARRSFSFSADGEDRRHESRPPAVEVIKPISMACQRGGWVQGMSPNWVTKKQSGMCDGSGVSTKNKSP